MDEPFNPAEQDPVAIEKQARLEELGNVIAAKRQDAIDGRAASGIEKVWMAAEEAYLGIDDHNRSEWQGARWAKPTSMEGPVTTNQAPTDSAKSTIYIPLTARYVDAGHAKVCEILLPVDDRPFSFDPTPVPELIKARNLMKAIMANGGEMPPEMAAQIQAQQQPQAAPAAPPVPGVAPAPAAPQAPGMAPAPQAAAPADTDPLAAAKQAVQRATDCAKRAEQRIYDWLVEARFPSEMRKTTFDAARIGVGVLKGPFADTRKSQAVTRDKDGNIGIEVKEKIVPGTAWKDPWDIFPDPGCGEDIHSGDYIFERDRLAARKVKALKKLPGYLPHMIDKVLKEGPGKCFIDNDGSANPNNSKDPKLAKRRFEVWYYYGVISREDVLAADTKGADSLPKEAEDIFVIVTLINDTAVRVVLNPLDSGAFPYRVFPWRRRAGHWAGVGIGEQADPAQRMCNGATRALMNNAGHTAGVQLVIDSEALVPADGRWVITPNKLWRKAANAVMEDVRKSFQAVELPDRQQSLMGIIEYSFKIAEESTNIPLISQGQSGSTTPDTYGAAQLQNNNANQLLRNVAALCDDNVTEPMINDYYEWLLLDPDVPDDEKGDFRINAHGSAALVERAIQDQTMAQLVAPSLNPAYGVNPKKVMTEYLKSKRIDPRFVAYTDEELANMAKQPPPEDPTVTAAKVRADAQIKVAESDNQTAQLRIKRDTDRDTVYVQAETTRDQQNAQAAMTELQLKRELAVMDYASKHQISLEQVKANLAETAMKLQTQKDLALAGHTVDLHKHANPAPMAPPVQVPGRAPDGRAFEQV